MLDCRKSFNICQLCLWVSEGSQRFLQKTPESLRFFIDAFGVES